MMSQDMNVCLHRTSCGMRKPAGATSVLTTPRDKDAHLSVSGMPSINVSFGIKRGEKQIVKSSLNARLHRQHVFAMQGTGRYLW